MEITYTVHSAARQDFQTNVTLASGQNVIAAVGGVVIELVSADETMTHTLKLIPENIDATLSEFVVGTQVVATFNKKEQ